MTVKIALSIAALITKVERRLAEYPNNRIISVTPNNKTHEAIPTPWANALTVTGKGERQLSSFGSARGGSGDAPGTLNSRVDWGNIRIRRYCRSAGLSPLHRQQRHQLPYPRHGAHRLHDKRHRHGQGAQSWIGTGPNQLATRQSMSKLNSDIHADMRAFQLCGGRQQHSLPIGAAQLRH